MEVSEEDAKRAEIKKIVDHFRGKQVSQNVINSFCNRNKLALIEMGDLDDFIFQVESDEKMGLLITAILKEMQNIKYVPVFVENSLREELEAHNEELRIKLVDIIEAHAISQLQLDTIGNTIASKIGQVIESAGVTADNRATSVMRDMARKHYKFGKLREFNSKHVADYIKESFKEENEKGEVPK